MESVYNNNFNSSPSQSPSQSPSPSSPHQQCGNFDSVETMCSICMENLTDVNKTTTQCGHVFHSSCIFQNLNFRTSCPLCRIDLVSKNNVSTPIPRQITNSNININNINYIYNFPSTPSRSLIEDDIINVLLDLESPHNENADTSFEDYLLETQGEPSPQYDSPQLQYGNNVIETYRNLTQEFDDVADADDDAEDDAEDDADDDDDDADDDAEDDADDDNLERYETDIPIKEVSNKMLEMGYTTEDMLYFMTWRINPFYFNRQYIEKYTPEFYNTMLETMHKIFTKEISIEPDVNNVPMSIDELN